VISLPRKETSSRPRFRGSMFSYLWNHIYRCLLPDYIVSIPEKIAKTTIISAALRAALRFSRFEMVSQSSEEGATLVADVVKSIERNILGLCKSLRYEDVCRSLKQYTESVFSELIVKERIMVPGIVAIEVERSAWEKLADAYDRLMDKCSDFPPSKMVRCSIIVSTAFLSIITPPLPWEAVVELLGEEE